MNLLFKLLAPRLVGVDGDVLSGERRTIQIEQGKIRRRKLLGAGSVYVTNSKLASQDKVEALYQKLTNSDYLSNI